MGQWDDDQIQRWLEAGPADAATGADADGQRAIETYALLFQALKQGPTGGLPYGFSRRVVTRLRRERQRRADRWFYSLLSLGVVVGLLLCIGVATGLSGEGAPAVLATLNTYKWLITFSVLGFALFQWGERTLQDKPVGVSSSVV